MIIENEKYIKKEERSLIENMQFNCRSKEETIYLTIGEGAVVGAGSVVTKDVTDYAVVEENTAQVIKYTE